MSRIRHQHYVQDGEPHGAQFDFAAALDFARRETEKANPGMGVRFLGSTYDPAQDEARLATALQRIRRALETGRAFTLKELAQIGQCSEAGASARVRDIRRAKERGGCGLNVVSSRVRGGLWKYEIVR